jgi:glycosyltransferase involved in cell wall biosynthesis
MDGAQRLKNHNMSAIQEGKYSVVIPVYNCEHYIGEAVESALAQTRPPHEIVVIDDGSTDGTRDVLQRYINSIKYVYQKNAGEPTARNNGIEVAEGEFIAFLDADDLWLPEKMQLQMECFAKDPECGLVYTDMKTFDETGILEESVRICRNLYFPSGWVFAALFNETLLQTSAAVFRKECVRRVGGFDSRMLVGSDYDFWLRIARNYRFGYVDVPLIMYRQHAGMATRNLGKALHEGMPWEVFLLKKILSLYPEAVQEMGPKQVNHRLSLPYFAMAYDAMRLGDHKCARKLLPQAIKYWPTNIRYQGYYLLSFLRPSHFSAMRSLYGAVDAARSRTQTT